MSGSESIVYSSMQCAIHCCHVAGISVAAVLRDFEILMHGDLCANYSRPPAQIGVSQILCEKTPMQSDQVTLRARGNNMRLITCEVEVFAHRTGTPCTCSHECLSLCFCSSKKPKLHSLHMPAFY